MKRRKLTATRTETIERVVVNFHGSAGRDEPASAGFCRKCNDEATWLGLTKASAFCDITLATIRELIELGSVHILITTDGHLVICERSLALEIAGMKRRSPFTTVYQENERQDPGDRK